MTAVYDLMPARAAEMARSLTTIGTADYATGKTWSALKLCDIDSGDSVRCHGYTAQRTNDAAHGPR